MLSQVSVLLQPLKKPSSISAPSPWNSSQLLKALAPTQALYSFSREFPYPLFIENEAAVEQAMFDFFLPLPTNTGTPENIVEIERITALRHAVKEDYLNYKTQMGVWQSIFTQTRPEAKTAEETKSLQKEITFDHIGKWLRETGNHNSRIRFFEAYAKSSSFYKHIAKRLLSMRTTGSISVERAAKPMKNNVMIKTRGRLMKEKGLVMLRAGLNMRLLERVKRGLNDMALDSGSDWDTESEAEAEDSDADDGDSD
jgi:hypothetical protein